MLSLCVPLFPLLDMFLIVKFDVTVIQLEVTLTLYSLISYSEY